MLSLNFKLPELIFSVCNNDVFNDSDPNKKISPYKKGGGSCYKLGICRMFSGEIYIYRWGREGSVLWDQGMKVQSLADETFLPDPGKLRSENRSGMIIFENA